MPYEDNVVQATPPAVLSPTVDDSLLSHLREVHQEKAEQAAEPLTLPIRGLDGAFGVRYEFPAQGIAPILKAGERLTLARGEHDRLDPAITTILTAYTEIVGRRPSDSDWQRPLGDRPLRIGEELAGILQLDLDGVKAKARFVCRNLFSPRARITGIYDGDLVLMEQAGEVMEYLQKARSAADDELAGE